MDNLLQLKDKNIVVMGVANDRSIAWGIAKALISVGANVIFTYRKERSLMKLENNLQNMKICNHLSYNVM
jgi:Enoyl-[acyl-carrier-protein] reductase [NADH] (EC 1.3.1.9)